ncbi:hypothetical protein LZ012_17305 [Dechloromonas sp. XY25]|uniref:Uncharacterized protein n=1 Tax=Dechloromonas hankyongensis TaxID=2908002 RepID=A0ABS9K6G9_9RHOO|nr:hypothetical protein [Dechloromonas hankyongensis]MCG2578758.1 hypothetical protein [Dechloromonas hankyongensis]
MRRWPRTLLAFAAVAGGVLGWGYWYALHHAAIHIRVDDYALKTQNQLYGVPHDVSLTLRDAAGSPLAAAHSVEPLGYILPVHPGAEVGDCRQYERSPSEYAACYNRHSQWSSTWAPHVQVADLVVGPCQLRAVPVAVYQSNSEWPLWWVPLPHVGGLPSHYYSFSIAIDSQACAPVSSPN